MGNPLNICELKLDGIRLILSNTSGQIQSWTRHKTPCVDRFPELKSLDLPNDIVLDGELIVSDELGHPDFESVMKRFQTTNERKIQFLLNTLPVQFCVFDILMFNGQDITSLPLYERKQILHDQIQVQPYLTLVTEITGEQADTFFELVKEQQLEGIVLKKADSRYQVGKRSSDWLKVINYHYHDVFLTGIKKKEFGWLIGLEEGNGVKPAGMIEFPPSKEVTSAVWSIAQKAKIKEDKDFIYLDPIISMKVKSRGFTKNNKIRIPVFQSFNFGGAADAG